MTTPTLVKLGLAAIGLIIWIYAIATEDDRLRWIGIAFLVAAFILRFWKRGGKTE